MPQVIKDSSFPELEALNEMKSLLQQKNNDLHEVNILLNKEGEILKKEFHSSKWWKKCFRSRKEFNLQEKLDNWNELKDEYLKKKVEYSDMVNQYLAQEDELFTIIKDFFDEENQNLEIKAEDLSKEFYNLLKEQKLKNEQQNEQSGENAFLMKKNDFFRKSIKNLQVRNEFEELEIENN